MGGAKRKAAQAADFQVCSTRESLQQKTKKKLGKGKQSPSNATNTSFKAKTISLPQQSITVDRSTPIVTRRHQTINDLVQNSHHYSPGVRRDAISGMLELIINHAGFASAETPTLIQSALPLIGDSDPNVRAAVFNYLKELLTQLKPTESAPFASQILLITTSAMSHITMPVRLDALRVLHLILDAFGRTATDGWESALDSEAVVDRHGQRILQAIFAMLGVATDAQRARVGMSTASRVTFDLPSDDRLRVLRALNHFMQVASGTSEATSASLWYFQSTFSEPNDREHFEKLFRDGDTNTMSEIELFTKSKGAPTAALYEALLAASRITQTCEDVPVTAYERLARMIHTLLLATLLDSLPAALSPDGSSPLHIELVAEVLAVALALWRQVVTEHFIACASQGVDATIGSINSLEQLLVHLAPHFPVITEQPSSTLTRVNMFYCELVALGAIAGVRRLPLTPTLEYLEMLLELNTMTSIQYEALLPTFWLFISLPNGAGKSLLTVLLKQFNAHPTAAAFRFLARVAILPTYRSLEADVSAVCDKEVQPVWDEWLLSLPRFLWRTTTHAVSPKTPVDDAQESRTLAYHVLEFLRYVAMSGGALFSSSVVAMLAPRLSPLFEVRHPKRGVLAGPVMRLPRDSYALALALIELLS